MSKKDKKDRSDDEEHGTKDITAELEAIEDWEDTEEDEGFGELKAGKQKVKIDEATVGKAKSSGRLQITLAMTIACNSAVGNYKGRKLWPRLGLDDDNRGRTRGALARLGVDWPKNPKKLPGALADLEGSYAEVSVRPSETSDSPWVNIVKAIDEDDVKDDTEDEDEDEDKKPKKKKASKAKEEEDDEDDEDEKPKKGAKKSKSDEDEDDDDDDEDEKPAKKKGKDADEDEDDEDDEDEKPKKKSKEADDDEDEDEKPSKSKKDEDEKVTVSFSDEDLDDDDKERIKKIAKKRDFEPKKYSSMTDLIIDVAEYAGVEGKFKKVGKLITAIKEQADE